MGSGQYRGLPWGGGQGQQHPSGHQAAEANVWSSRWPEDRPALAPGALLGPKWLTILHLQIWQCRIPPGAGRRSPRQEGGWRCHFACSPLASPAGCLMGRKRVRPGCQVLRRLILAGEADEPGRRWGEEFCRAPAALTRPHPSGRSSSLSARGFMLFSKAGWRLADCGVCGNTLGLWGRRWRM